MSLNWAKCEKNGRNGQSVPDAGKAGLVPRFLLPSEVQRCRIGREMDQESSDLLQFLQPHSRATLASEASRFNFFLQCVAPIQIPRCRGTAGWCRVHKLQPGTAAVCPEVDLVLLARNQAEASLPRVYCGVFSLCQSLTSCFLYPRGSQGAVD